MEHPKKGRWIWYPGEFEYMLGLKVWGQRCERGSHITPEWRVDPLYPNIWFRKTVTVSSDTVLYPRANGELALRVDHETWYREKPLEGVALTAGTHFIELTVFNPTGLPCFYLDHSEVKTDESWEATWVKGAWKQAACRDFSDPLKPPCDLEFSTQVIPPVSVEEKDGGLLLDFGRELMGFLRFSGVSRPGTIPAAFGESREEALDVGNCELYEQISVSEGSVTEFTRAFRYVFLPGAAGRVRTVEALYQYLPLGNKGAFRCGDQQVNQIYDTALYTLHLCSREFYLDGIKRDRWVWSGDATQSYLLNFYTFFDKDICRRTMRLLRGKDPVMTHLNTIQDYSLYWLISLFDYHLYTGDAVFLAEIYEDAKGLLRYCMETVDDRSFFNPRPMDWVFVDWAPIDNSGDVSAIQILFARALEAMAHTAQATGHPEDAETYRQAFQQTLAACFAEFWDSDKGGFTHGPAAAPNAVVTRYPNLFALLFGYLKGEQKQSVIDHVLLNDSVLPITTPYMKFYELMALCEAGETQAVWRFIKEYWGGMLREGATSFWEEYNPAQKGAEHYAMYGKPYGKSLCHAWAAGPVMLLTRYFLGVRPTAPGYARFEVIPCPPGQPVSGAVPTGDGIIRVTCDPDSVTVVNETGGEGSLLWKGETHRIPPRGTVSI